MISYRCLFTWCCNAIQVNGRPLAAKPDLTSLLRCRWAPTLQLQPQFVLKAASDVAVRVLLHLAQPLSRTTACCACALWLSQP
jgi:hypothetical protein